MRVFVPATTTMLRALIDDGEFSPISRTAFAVTPTLREAYSSGDDDELADVALREAARASLRLLGGEGEVDETDGGADADADVDAAAAAGSAPRRVVIAADVDPVTLRPDLDDAVVRLPQPLSLRQVASVHVDLAEAEPAVRAAVEAIDAADLGDVDAEFVLGDAEDHELAWYAPQEIPFLLDLM
ncbi:MULTISPECIES: DUF6912 family protein [Nocardiaceae]|uniref:Uncharacterized protein n=1 Tax=Rhodococcoides kroppenstedtii TaxID=293050 RepID=A0ABS7NRJ0_9NOCA|nr:MULTISPECIES: hypothetical protein [Rhodococcus]AMY19391.1 hypothetical protein A3Q40_02015 [Rhodococcus sp. PBTS 1]MBY6312696.1 hypothetical protein [Rhodococcus kroppenstedtii]MBY6320636.1 hypothetical protein [Rhodococcus kroppenstedtii]MBY6399453.1 hypothetical protein [Rhodococcus kroppenstedtii]